MNTKTNIALLVVAVLLVTFILIGGNPFGRDAGSEVKREPIFAGAIEGTPAAITISQEGQTVELARAGETWVVKSAQDHPAADSRITELLDKLRSFKTESYVARSSKTHEKYKVTEALGCRVTLKDAAGKTLADAIIGESQGLPKELMAQLSPDQFPDLDRTKNPYTYVRSAGDDVVWVVRVNVAGAFSADVNQWLERRVVDLEMKDVVRIAVKRPGDEIVLERSGDGGTPDDAYDDTWVLAADPALPALRNVAQSMVSRVTSASITSLVENSDSPTGLAEPGVVATVTTADGRTATVEFGDPTDTLSESPSEYYMSVAGKPFVYRVGAYAYKELTKPREEILDLDLATYSVRQAQRIEISEGAGEGATTFVLVKDGQAWDSPWKVESPEGYETDKDAVDVLLGALAPAPEKKASGYVTDGSTWDPGPGSRTFRITPTAWGDKPAVVETITLAPAGSATDGKLRVRVGGRVPDLLIDQTRVEALLSPVDGWVWKPAPEVEVPATQPAVEEPAVEEPGGEEPAAPGDDGGE